MLCPTCDDTPLERGTLSTKKLTLDKCQQCKGIWFDKQEFCALLGDKAYQDFTVPKFAVEMPKIHCPRCKVGLYELCYPGTMVLVDACRQCGGIWLDKSECKAISYARDEGNKITCPKCHARQQPAATCSSCGIIIAKWTANAQYNDEKTKMPKKFQNVSGSSYADNIPGLKGSLLRMIDKSIKNLTEILF